MQYFSDVNTDQWIISFLVYEVSLKYGGLGHLVNCTLLFVGKNPIIEGIGHYSKEKFSKIG